MIFAKAALISLLASGCMASLLGAPPGKKVLFGVWMRTGTGVADSPVAFNSRIGEITPVFQFAQTIPAYTDDISQKANVPEHLIEETSSNAALYLTIYPSQGFDAIKDYDINVLAGQVAYYYHRMKRDVYIRFAPEMQGSWNIYGMQPAEFVRMYRKIHKAIKRLTPNAAMIWGPNMGYNYPWGQNFDKSNTSAENRQLLDTNGNGRLDAGDDPYSPYFPGDEYVDWAGISLYYKGPWEAPANTLPWEGYCTDILEGNNHDGTFGANFYASYCQGRTDRACMFTESGTAFHDGVKTGIDQFTMQKHWIDNCIANQTFFDTHPEVKMINQFEFVKYDDADLDGLDLQDYRLSQNIQVRDYLNERFSELSDYFQWASYRQGLSSKVAKTNRTSIQL